MMDTRACGILDSIKFSASSVIVNIFVNTTNVQSSQSWLYPNQRFIACKGYIYRRDLFTLLTKG